MEDKELTKYVESMCEDCMLGIVASNCRNCLFSILKYGKKGDWQTNK